jgi:hypothetical protein
MNTKVIVGGIAGGVAFFLLGWVIYGMLLMDFMTANTNQSMAKPMGEYVWWALILGNLMSGFLLATIFSWSNISGAADSAKAASIVGLLMGLSYDLMFYSMSNMFSNVTAIIVDVLACTIMSAIAGAVVGMAMGMVKAQTSPAL